MSRYSLALVAVVSLALVFAFAAAEAGTTMEEDLAAIGKVRDMEAAHVGAADPEARVAAYTDEVHFMPPGHPAISGKEGVQSWLTAMLEEHDVKVSYTSSKTRISGDWAFENYAGTATFTPKAGGEAVVEQIKGIHIYRRQADGSWRITHDIWNSDAEPPME